MRLATWWVVQQECPTHPTCHLHGVKCSYHIIDIHLVLWEGLQPVSFKNASNISNEIHADYAIGRVSQQKFPIWSDTTTLTATVVFFFPPPSAAICASSRARVRGCRNCLQSPKWIVLILWLVLPRIYVPTTLIPSWLFFVTLWIPLVICATAMEHRKFASTDPL